MSAIHSIAPPGVAQEKKAPSYLERLANALVYIIAFPFIAVFIAIKRIFTERKEPAHSYYNQLPEQHMLGGNGAAAVSGGDVGASGNASVASRTRSKKA